IYLWLILDALATSDWIGKGMCFVRGREAEAIKRFRVSELYDAAGNSRIRSTVHRNPPNSSPPEVRIRRHLSSLCELSLSLSLSLTSHFKPLSLLSDCCFVEGFEMQWQRICNESRFSPSSSSSSFACSLSLPLKLCFSSDQTPAVKSSGFPFYSPSPLPSLFKPSAASASSTPLRIFKRPFPPPSPAKHIRAFLARCNGSTNKPNKVTIPGNSGRWLPSPGPLSHQFEAESFSSSRDLRSANQVSSRRLSFSSSFSDGDHSFRRGGGGFEHAYSFVGMHCIFDQCKSSGIFLHLLLDLIDLVCDFPSLLCSYCSEVWPYEF
ncbi:hypothetical protein HID58_017251, partial [Brassica napus]